MFYILVDDLGVGRPFAPPFGRAKVWLKVPCATLITMPK